MGKTYGSPRWSGEILDCSMPMTFDTYSHCSYNCLYCFSFFQKSHALGDGGTDKGKQDYQDSIVRWVDVERIKELFNLSESCNKGHRQFFPYIRDRKVMQWGGLADQFDENERKQGVSLELMKFFKEINYPLCYSTKAVWWIEDERYYKLIEGQENWNCKFSIINLDPDMAKGIERAVETPQRRLEALKIYSRANPKGGATLRLRPFIIGMTDKDDEYLDLIRQAKENGATAVSTEFFCLERRADDRLKKRYEKMSNVIGFDIYDFYVRYSSGSGYLRLSYKIKRPYMEKMETLCKKLGLRFYVSDAHHKEKCNNGSCCGLNKDWNYSRGQFTHALMIAKEKGEVRFSDIEEHLQMYKDFRWQDASGFNTNSALARAVRCRQTMFDYIKEQWNSIKSGKSPYKYFEGILYPTGQDEEGNVIYAFNYEKARMDDEKNNV